MSVIAITGGNSGQLADVRDNALLIRPVSDYEQAVADGLAFSWSSLDADIDATDTVLAVENDSATYDLYIQTITMSTDTSSQMVVFTSSSVTMAGTAVTGVNLNRNSSFVAPVTAKADETGNTQAASTYSLRLLTARVLANTTFIWNADGAIILPYNHIIGIDLTTEPTGCNATIVGYFKARE